MDILHSNYYHQYTHVTKTSDRLGEDIGSVFGLFVSHVSSHNKNENIDSARSKLITIFTIDNGIKNVILSEIFNSGETLFWSIVVDVTWVGERRYILTRDKEHGFVFPRYYIKDIHHFEEMIRVFHKTFTTDNSFVKYTVSQTSNFGGVRDRILNVLISEPRRDNFLGDIITCISSFFKKPIKELKWRYIQDAVKIMQETKHNNEANKLYADPWLIWKHVVDKSNSNHDSRWIDLVIK
jgi:hypothetical protein